MNDAAAAEKSTKIQQHLLDNVLTMTHAIPNSAKLRNFRPSGVYPPSMEWKLGSWKAMSPAHLAAAQA